MSNQEYPLKHVRLAELYKAGFNVADFICFPPNTLRGREEELRAFLTKHGTISCRHFHENEKTHFKCPVKYEQTDFDTILAFCMANNYGNNEQGIPFYTLCNEAINLQDSICAGNILVLDERNYFVEYFNGPGTPRDIESKGADELKIYTRNFGAPTQGTPPPEIVRQMAFKASKYRPVKGPYILEFSLYPYPIGRSRSTMIIWEWRLGWLHYQLQANKFLLEENQRLLAQVRQLEAQVRALKPNHELPATPSGTVFHQDHCV